MKSRVASSASKLTGKTDAVGIRKTIVVASTSGDTVTKTVVDFKTGDYWLECVYQGPDLESVNSTTLHFAQGKMLMLPQGAPTIVADRVAYSKGVCICRPRLDLESCLATGNLTIR